ncbi:hypothetical protein JKG47_00525 [Acidithiobacillus sp. MC6.1]|nr:hypothetical protein [Acidithiobacillus sp. MC6.1]
MLFLLFRECVPTVWAEIQISLMFTRLYRYAYPLRQAAGTMILLWPPVSKRALGKTFRLILVIVLPSIDRMNRIQLQISKAVPVPHPFYPRHRPPRQIFLTPLVPQGFGVFFRSCRRLSCNRRSCGRQVLRTAGLADGGTAPVIRDVQKSRSLRHQGDRGQSTRRSL